MSRIVITGAAGFIGRHLSARLAANGHDVIGLVRRAPAAPLAPPIRLDVRAGIGATVPAGRAGSFRAVVTDLLDPSSVRPWLSGADWVVHLAGTIDARRADDFRRNNVLVTRHLLERCRERGSGRPGFLYLSSVAAQGPGYEGRPLRETDPCRPETEYGRSKEEAERTCRRFRRDVALAILRPPFVYGRGDRRGAGMVHSLLGPDAASLFGRMRTIGLCHVADLVDACLAVLASRPASGEVFLVSDGEEHTPATLRVTLGGILRRPTGADPDPLRPGSAPAGPGRLQDWACDISRARRRLGFAPRVRFADGARDTIEWYRECGLLPASIPVSVEER